MKNIIAVDGEAAAGKSACSLAADWLGFSLLETGLIYRGITFLVLKHEINVDDTDDVALFVADNIHRFIFVRKYLYIDIHKLDDELRQEDVEKLTPKIAKIPAVRRLVIPLQHDFNGGDRVIAEGRDIGSVIFPDARLKIFLTAPLKTRAERRMLQYPGRYESLKDAMEQLEKRDEEDKNRPDSPLVRVPDAIVIDTSLYGSKAMVAERIVREWNNLFL